MDKSADDDWADARTPPKAMPRLHTAVIEQVIFRTGGSARRYFSTRMRISRMMMIAVVLMTTFLSPPASSRSAARVRSAT